MKKGKKIIALCTYRVYDTQEFSLYEELVKKLKAINCYLFIYALNSEIGIQYDILPEIEVFNMIPYDKVDVVVVMNERIKVREVCQEIIDRANAHDVPVVVMSVGDEESIACVRALVPKGEVAVLIGKSGVGKSSLVNLLAGADVQSIGDVRASDGKGRHTTVDRVMVEIPDAGRVVDMPGIRGLGLWDSDTGIDVAFTDVAELAEQCRFRDCKHTDEPGCAVLAAVESGELAQARLDSYRSLVAEVETTRKRRDEARHMRGEKASDRKRQKRKGR